MSTESSDLLAKSPARMSDKKKIKRIVLGVGNLTVADFKFWVIFGKGQKGFHKKGNP